MWHTNIMELGQKLEEILTYATTWMNHENMLDQRRVTDTHHIFYAPFICNARQADPQKQRVDQRFPRSPGRKMNSWLPPDM